MIVGQWLSFGIGGADKASYLLTKGLIELGVEVKIFYNEKSFPNQYNLSRYSQCESLGVPMFKIDKLSDLNNYGLQILNTHRSGDDLWLIPGFEQTNFNFKIVETNIHGYTRSKADIRIFPSYEMIKGKNITCPYNIIPNPIMCKLSESNLKQELGLDDKFVFGRIARPEMYSRTCLKAFKLIENNNIHFLYVAPCDLSRKDTENFRIKNITFIDQTINEVYISKLYNTFDVLCHSNNMGETFGNTIAEAMIHGKPVISHLGSNWPQAQKEVMGEYGDTYVCENNINQYSKLMSRLFEDKQEYINYSNYIKDRANSLYDYRVVVKKYIDVYNTF
jgi:glycosyltransferase involved in cell wall biosynthesis